MVNNNGQTDEVYIVARFGCERDLARKAPVDIERPLPDDTAHTCTESRSEMRLFLPTPSNRPHIRNRARQATDEWARLARSSSPHPSAARLLYRKSNSMR